MSKRKRLIMEEDNQETDNDLPEDPQVQEDKLPPLALDVENLRVSQWVVVPYEIGHLKKMFVGQILGLDNDHKTANVKFLEKKAESEKYAWPKQEDSDSVPFSEIVRILREPTFDRWGNLMFQDYY